MTFRDLLAPHADGLALDRLVRYAELLERWAATHNLVHYHSRAELVHGHIADAICDGGPRGARGHLADVGSGAGLPGIPRLCLACGWSGLLLEPRQKRWAFLRTVVRELGLPVVVERARYQDADPETGRYDEVTARGVGGHRSLLQWARPRLTTGGAVLLWIGREDAAALGSLADWRVVTSARCGHPGGRLVRLEPCST